MIVLTGGAGFIGTNTLIGLNNVGEEDVLVVDNINTTLKWQHLVGRKFYDYVHKNDFWTWIKEHPKVNINAVIHLGACSDTTEQDFDYFMNNNVRYSQRLWQLCAERGIPFIYASSAATYGSGEQGFSDKHEKIFDLRPINAYGFSKHIFDLWALRQTLAPPKWAGLKFFNVYGPYEDHKGRMVSVVFHAYPQARDKGCIRLFKSHRDDYQDGEQKRDFIYVKDVVDVMLFFMQDGNGCSGIYNVGSGVARSFNDLAAAVFQAMGEKVEIEYFGMPLDLQPRYQYFTEAKISKLRQSGFTTSITSLEKGVDEYVNYLDEAIP